MALRDYKWTQTFLRIAEEAPQGFDEAFLTERDELMVDRLRLALTVGLAIYAAFWGLDISLHPDMAPLFGATRLGVVVMCLLVLRATYHDWGRARILPLSVGILIIVGSSISSMTVWLGGFGNDYYIGNMLTLFFVGLFMPWPVKATVAFCVALVAPYLLINGFAYGLSAEAAAASAFLIGTSALTCFSTAVSHVARHRDLTLRLRLKRANEELTELDEAKTRFFANVSHELRTPLMLISGPLEELMSNSPSGPDHTLLQSMAANADRLTRQVNMILDFARIEGGRLRVKLFQGNLGNLLQRLVDAAAPYANQHRITLEPTGLAEVPDTYFDPDHLETVAANLISNAVKFTPDGGRIDVRAWAEGEMVAFEVKDTGIGISEDQQQAIFDRFHQVAGGEKGKNKGTGLGLALCRELVVAHGGSLTVRSKPDEGSRFRVLLPREPKRRQERRQRPRRRADRMAQAHLDNMMTDSYERRQGTQTLLADIHQPDVDTQTQSAALAAVAPEDAPNLLIVEDNPEFQALLVRNLGSTYKVLTASDGEMGLETARIQPPDLIISDIMMPKMNGIEMVEALSHDPALMKIPVILLTARTGVESVVAGLGVGAVDYVTKPFKIPELRARIEAQLRARATEKALDERETRLAAVGQMTSQIAHDLRGPLTAIVGHTEIAREIAAESEETAFIVEDLDAVEEAAHRAVHMIQEVVDYVREGSVPLRTESTHLGGFLESVAQDLRDSLEPLGISLTVTQNDGDELELAVDRLRLRRVVENLVTNAREAIIEQNRDDLNGSPHNIWIEVRGAKESVAIDVLDDGPGIPDTVTDKLFQPFITAGKTEGTGLGLAIVRNLVAAHGGTITVDSPKPLIGAAFRVTLPRQTTT